MNNPIRILTCSKPYGDRGPSVGFINHMAALSRDDRFEFDDGADFDFYNFSGDYILKKIESADVFWFYGLPVSTRSYNLIKDRFPEKLIWGGPNLFLEKGETGPTTEFEHWAMDNFCCDIYSNVARYYMNHVCKFYKLAKRNVELPYCIDLYSDIYKSQHTRLLDRPVDLLIYKKKRRNDSQNDQIYNEVMSRINSSHLAYGNVRTLIYGEHSREAYLEACKSAKLCLWLGIEDYCSLAQLECYSCGTPIVGTPYNLTIPIADRFVAKKSQKFSDWIEWSDSAAENLVDVALEALSSQHNDFLARSYVARNHSHEAYADKVFEILKGKNDK